MKGYIAFILLLLHVNSSMLLPQAPMQDVFDANGNQADDISSILELIRVDLGFDHHSDDENNDNGQNFHITHCEYTIKSIQQDSNHQPIKEETNHFVDHLVQNFSLIFYDILVPPPKA